MSALKSLPLLAILMCASALSAQQGVIPANLPPADYGLDEFIDNAGCAFARTETSGQVIWVPRVNAQREPVCGLVPTFGSAGTTAEAEGNDTDAVEDQAAAVAGETASDGAAPADDAATAATATEETSSASAGDAGSQAVAPEEPVAEVTGGEADAVPALPDEPVADISGTADDAAILSDEPVAEVIAGDEPALADTVAAADSTAEVIAPAPPRPRPAPPPPPAPRRAAPAPAIVPPPPPPVESLTLEQACIRQATTGVRLIDVATGKPIVCGSTSASVASGAEPRRLTREAACAEQAATGVRLIDVATGAPVVCPLSLDHLAPAPRVVAPGINDPLAASTLSGRQLP